MLPMQQPLSAHTPEELFGLAVSAYRSNKKLSQRDFAAKLTDRGMPVDASAVSRIEKGSRSVRLVEALTIAEVLEVDLDLLVSGARSPSQQFQSMRRRTNAALHNLQEPVAQAAFALWIVQDLVREHPELLATLEDEKHGRPTEPDAYLGWVAARAEGWTVLPEEYLTVDTEEEAERIVDVITRVVRLHVGLPRASDDDEPADEDESDGETGLEDA